MNAATSAATKIRRLSASEARECLSALAAVLVDCVEGGASVSFMLPFTLAEAEEFFRKVADGVAEGERILLAAFAESKLVGTVQIVTAMPPNQPHRGDVSKLLVHRSARGRGVGSLLMQHVEKEAKAVGKTLLVLDTVTGGDAERLYQRLNWVKGCVIPRYAYLPDGRWGDTTIFWKQI
jgi:GNAT superfamily N-acetyltransferase